MFTTKSSASTPIFTGNNSIEYDNSMLQSGVRDGQSMREYCLAMAMRIWSMYSPLSTEQQRDFALYESYARGVQDMSRYRRFTGIKKLGQSESSAQIQGAIDDSIGLGLGKDGDMLRYKGLSSIIEAAQGRIVPMKREAIVTANNKAAIEEKNAQKAKTVALNYLKQSLPPETLQYADTSGVQPIEEKPLPIEETQTTSVNLVLNGIGTEWRKVEEYLSWTQIVQGIAGVKIDVTPTFSIKYRPIDVTRLVMPPPTQNDCKDLKCIGEIIVLSVADLMQLDVEKKYTNSDWAACPVSRNSGVFTDSGVNWDRLVNVLDVEWTDVKRGTGLGDILCVYRAKFVIGTTIVVDFGEKEFQVRGSLASGEFSEISHFSFILESPYISAKALRLNSLVSRCIGEIEVAQQCKINFIKELVHAKPTFYGFTESTFRLVDDLFNGTLDKTNNNEKIDDPYLLMDMINKTLVVIPDPQDTGAGIIKPEPPIKMEGGLGQATMNYLLVARQAIESVKENMGLPNGVIASMPDPNQSVAAQKNAISAAESVLSKIQNANESIFKRVANHIAMIVPQIMWDLKNGRIPYSDLAQLFTSRQQEILSNISEIYNHNFTFQTTSAPTVAEMTDFIDSLNLAVQGGIITGSQKIRFQRLAQSDFERALGELELAESQNAERQHQQQMETIQANTQGNVEAAQISNEGVLAKVEAEKELELAKIKAQAEADIAKMRMEQEMAIEKMKEEYRLKAQLELLIIDNTPKPKTENGN